jgi:hypothetical protein
MKDNPLLPKIKDLVIALAKIRNDDCDIEYAKEVANCALLNLNIDYMDLLPNESLRPIEISNQAKVTRIIEKFVTSTQRDLIKKYLKLESENAEYKLRADAFHKIPNKFKEDICLGCGKPSSVGCGCPAGTGRALRDDWRVLLNENGKSVHLSGTIHVLRSGRESATKE